MQESIVPNFQLGQLTNNMETKGDFEMDLSSYIYNIHGKEAKTKKNCNIQTQRCLQKAVHNN